MFFFSKVGMCFFWKCGNQIRNSLYHNSYYTIERERDICYIYIYIYRYLHVKYQFGCRLWLTTCLDPSCRASLAWLEKIFSKGIPSASQATQRPRKICSIRMKKMMHRGQSWKTRTVGFLFGIDFIIYKLDVNLGQKNGLRLLSATNQPKFGN